MFFVFQGKIPREERAIFDHVEFGVDDDGIPVGPGFEQGVDQMQAARPAHTGIDNIEALGLVKPECVGDHVTVAGLQKATSDTDIDQQIDKGWGQIAGG